MRYTSNLFKKSRIHGANRRQSYYRIKSKRAKWYKVSKKKINYVARSNKTRISPLSYTRNKYLRLNGLVRMGVHNRLYWKSMYPTIDVAKVRLDRHSALRDQCKQGESVLWKLESRLDVALWRSGMVTTVRQAKQRVRSGAVEFFKDGQWCVAERADQLLDVNTVVKLLNWSALVKPAKEKWLDKRFKHKVPSYLLVDYVNGIMALRHKPKDGEVIAPSYLPVRIASLIKTG